MALGDKALEVALGVLVGQSLDERREHQAGHHAVQADAARRIDHRGGLRHLHQGRLARGVGDLGLADVAQARDRRDVDNRAAALSLHLRQHVLAGEECAFEVDVHLLVPDRFVHRHRVARLRAADVVDQDVDAAKAGDAGLHQRLHVGGAGHVADLHLRHAAFGLDQFAGGLCGFLIQVAAIDAGALARQQHGDRLAVAPAFPHRPAPRHQGDFSIESEHACSLLVRSTGDRPTNAQSHCRRPDYVCRPRRLSLVDTRALGPVNLQRRFYMGASCVAMQLTRTIAW
jgi:hypothetical protein